MGEVLVRLSMAVDAEPLDGYISQTHGRYDARPMVTLPAISHPADGRRLSWPECLLTH